METHTKRPKKEQMITAVGSWGRPVLLLVLGASLLAGFGGCPKKPEVMTPAPVAVAPPPPPPAPVAEVPKPAPPQLKSLSVFFDTDKADLRPGEQQKLDEAVRWLKSNPEARISLDGYADERGTEKHNVPLSDRRAAAVRSYMVAGGIDAGRIVSITGHGATRQFAPGSDEAALQLNRRVDITGTR